MTTKHDDELEARLRTTLQAVAAATPVEERPADYAVERSGRRRPRWLTPLTAAAAMVTLVVGAAVVVRALDDGEVTVSSPTSTASPTPPAPPSASDRPGLSDGPIFTGDGHPSLVFHQYRETRLPDVSTSVTTGNGVATATWSFDDDGGQVAAGTVHLAYLADRWAVVEATTDDVSVDGLTVENGRLTATVSTTNINSFVVEILDTDGNRFRGGERLGPTRDPVELDVTIGDQPVVVRVQLIGGTMLSLTELLVDPNAPDGGTEAAAEPWAGGTWRAMTTEDCGWIELNGVAQDALCGADPTPHSFAQFGPVSRFEDETLYYGIVGSGLERVRIRDAKGQLIGEELARFVSGSAFRLMILSVAAEATTAEFLTADGSVVGQVELDPGGPLGG